MEFFILAAPNDALGLFDSIFSTALAALSYDPNYTEAMEDDEDDEDADDDECAWGWWQGLLLRERARAAASGATLQGMQVVDPLLPGALTVAGQPSPPA